MPVKSKKEKVRYACQSCGFVSLRWLGKCSECGAWNSFIEEVVVAGDRRSRQRSGGSTSPVNLANVTCENGQRILTASPEFNRVLGGGIVSGSVILLGGDPGIG
ncbi:MAG TPA: DNA repair protein RadA, partial [bacterium]